MKIFSKLSLLLLSFSIFSCASGGLRIPGESKIILKNVSTEYYNIAEGYLGLKNYNKAIEYYKLAMRNEDLYLSSYYKLARCYALAKDWNSASVAYKELLELDPENGMIKTSLAYITAMKGETDEAILAYKKLMEENPHDENILESYTALLIHVGRGEDAEAYYFLLKEKFPDNKQLTTFAQQLAEIVDNFDAEKDKKPESLLSAGATGSQ